MKLLYISHPCTSCGNIEQNRIQAAKYAEKYKALGYHVINPLDVINPEADTEEAMEISFKLLWDCETIVMCGNWNESKGCKQELKWAEEIGKEIIYDGGMK